MGRSLDEYRFPGEGEDAFCLACEGGNPSWLRWVLDSQSRAEVRNSPLRKHLAEAKMVKSVPAKESGFEQESRTSTKLGIARWVIVRGKECTFQIRALIRGRAMVCWLVEDFLLCKERAVKRK